jgi:hypothetical protein
MVIPHKPSEPPTRGDGTSSSQLEVYYPLLTGELTGGSPLTSLHL